ncbi:hypothetical protein [Paenarthrobacter ilicis]|uniref:Uncharacterized protein n=1 Tax=Paenarthrobacter ilicis TaxID=43665 RepID=A0ABX0TL63_9MICC|nr:hypothetical protein [Paenarthrobacter ilicis]MBM7792938.1 hypothetical protein [Paenarthrobacter ilicis]NIJ03314.1 hypothetical protein [Paenarthrobacter ilicis]
MEYNGSPAERAVAAGDLDRRHVGQSVSFQPNDFTVVFGTIAGIARTEALVYLSLSGVAGGTHLKDEYDLPVDKHVYLQLDPLGSAEKGLSEAASFVKDKLDEITRNIKDRDQGKSE